MYLIPLNLEAQRKFVQIFVLAVKKLQQSENQA